MGENKNMADDFNDTETCAICRGNAAGSHAYCHFYVEGRRIALCSPACAEEFLRGPARPGNGNAPRDVIEEMVEDLRWTPSGY